MVTKSESDYETQGFCNVAWGNTCQDPAGFGIGGGGGYRASAGKGSTKVRCFECDDFACSECRVTIDNVLVCLNCAERRIKGIGSLQSEVDHTTALPEKAAAAERVRVILDGVTHVYLARSCPKGLKHDAHPWISHWYGYDQSAKDNAYCPGLEKDKFNSSAYTTTWKPKKDYSEDAENFPFSNPITVSQARKIAHHMHRDQKDKSGRPYTEHLNAVEQGVYLFGGTAEERVAALFHDSVEDYHTTYDLLRKINVTEASIKMIEAVSKRFNEEQGKYLARIIEAGPGAMRVKLADLFHNTRHDRIQALRDDKKDYVADRLLKKYRPSIAALMLELGMIVDEDAQKKLATKPIGSSSGWSSHTVTPKKKPGSTSTVKKTEPETVVYGSNEATFPVAAKDLLLDDYMPSTGLWVVDVDTEEDGLPKGKRGITLSDGSYEVVEEDLIFNVSAEY